ncbi:MAG: hypothetical protein QOD35_2752 [Nocardioidaceae bacterium]|jgi:hypothetical protein|nr:hypothetical protein [Nocardioidaceae bacterium]
MPSPLLVDLPARRKVDTPLNPTWTATERAVGRAACWVIFVLSVAYVPAMLAGFLANGGFDEPVADPYLAIMEVLILLMAIPLVMLFACVHAYAPANRKTLSLSALALVTVAVGITVCVHVVQLTAGRQLGAATSPGYNLLLSWTWPSVAFALDIASWDFFLGFGLILAATAFTGSGPPRLVRRGLLVSGAVCLFGLAGAATGNMGMRDIGIAGYAVILPVVLLVMARVFAATPGAETPR